MTAAEVPAQAAGELLQEIVRAFKVRRLYAETHPQRTATEAAAAGRVAAILETHGSLAIALEDGEPRWEDQPVPIPPDSSLVSVLYHEGIRELAFHPGLEPGELARFLDHAAAAAGGSSGEEDLLAGLWEEVLPHIHYVFVEQLADQEWTPEVERRDEPDETAAGPVVLESEDREALARPVIPLPDPTAYRLTESELADLQDELEAEKARGLLHEALTCMRELLFDPPHEDPAPVLGALADVQSGLLRETRLAAVRELHDVFRPYLESPAADRRVKEGFERLRSAALDGSAIARHAGRLDEGRSYEEDLVRYLELFGPEHVPGLLGALPEIKRLCQRPAVGGVLAALAARNAGALRAALADGAEPVAVTAAFVAGMLADSAFGPALEGALRRPEPRVRLEAIQALKHLGEGGVPFAARAVDDADRAVRVYALRHVIAHRFEPAFDRVAALFGRIDEEAESAAERRLVYEAYGALGRERAVDELARRMTRRGVLRRHDPEATVCAIAGLAATGAAGARGQLEAAARDRDEKVREAARSALARWSPEGGDR